MVTGASSGIGRAIAWELARRGHDVLVHAAESRPALEQSAADIGSLGRAARTLLCDFRDREALAAFARSAWEAFGRVDVWVNNAGGDLLTGQATGWEFSRKLDLLWQVDVAASLLLSREIGRHMVRRARQQAVPQPDESRLPRPAIINIGWDQATWGMAGDSGELFAAAKGAVMAMTMSLAHSLAPEVRVNCVAPGWIQTDWGRRASEPWHERARRQSLSRRWGKPEDVAQVVAWLAGPESDFVNGQVIDVNGGFCSWPTDGEGGQR
jgi:3-oxoacyl-[acyl-carrier protein] reductase